MRLLIIIIVIMHAALALTFKVMFFSYYVVKLGPDVSIPPMVPGNGTSTTTSHISTAPVATASG
jgi:hypothetical protein